MQALLKSLPLVALALAVAGPASARVLAEGNPSRGFYWQKIEKSNGQLSYLCRPTSDAKIQAASKCEGAGAKKP